MSSSIFPVVEIFGSTLAGEGALAGQPSHFLRLGLCDGAAGTGRSSWCTWCDSMQAVDPVNKKDWRYLTAREIEDEINALPSWCRTLTITGGNPVLHDLGELTTNLLFQRYTLWVETQGTRYAKWLDPLNVTVSPKPPSAGAHNARALDDFLKSRKRTSAVTALKVVVDPDNAADLAFARSIFETYRWPMPFVSVVTYPDDDQLLIIDRWRKVVDWVLSGWLGRDKAYAPTVLPQLHALLWLHEKGK